MEENRMKLTSKEDVPKKMSYELLENIAHLMSEQSRSLHNQNLQLIQKLQEANLANFFKRLDWLWIVINSDTTYLTDEFKRKCGEEFMENMTPQLEDKEPKS